MKLVLRDFDRAADYERQREMFRLAFPETEGTPQPLQPHYLWKFAEAPGKPPSYEFVASEGEKLLGYYAAIPFPYVVGGTKRNCGMVCDVMTHPDARGKGVFTKLGRFATDAMGGRKVDFVSGYPIRPEVIPGHLKVGWSVVFKEPIYARPLKTDSLMAWAGLGRVRWASAFIDPFVSGGNKLRGAVTRGSYEVSVLTREQFFADESYEGLFSEWAAEQTNYLIKDRAFLHWRTRAPGAGYQFVKLSLGGQWAGLAITRATDLSGVPTLAVLDLMVPSKHRAGLSRLHQGLFELASRERAELIATMMSPSSAGRNRLVQNLFIRTPAVFSIIFKVLNPELNRGTFSREQDWSLTWLDSDNL